MRNDVERFIRNFVKSEEVFNLFASGYCYHFAHILKAAFGRGEVCWVVGRAHIVWVDEDGCAYDVGGLYVDYSELRPAEYLGKLIVDFIHNGDRYICRDEDFHTWCNSMDSNDMFEITRIWLNIPKELLKMYDDMGFDAEEAALRYWREKITGG